MSALFARRGFTRSLRYFDWCFILIETAASRMRLNVGNACSRNWRRTLHSPIRSLRHAETFNACRSTDSRFPQIQPNTRSYLETFTKSKTHVLIVNLKQILAKCIFTRRVQLNFATNSFRSLKHPTKRSFFIKMWLLSNWWGWLLMRITVRKKIANWISFCVTLLSVVVLTVTPAHAKFATCSKNYYKNSSGICVHRPSKAKEWPAGSSAKCWDGTYSYSQSRRGTCSHHGGVQVWR